MNSTPGLLDQRRQSHQPSSGDVQLNPRPLDALWLCSLLPDAPLLSRARTIYAFIGVDIDTGSERWTALHAVAVEIMGYLSPFERIEDETPDGSMLQPIVAIIVHWSLEPWTGPRRLQELMEVPEGKEKYVLGSELLIVDPVLLSDEDITSCESDLELVFRAMKSAAPASVRKPLSVWTSAARAWMLVLWFVCCGRAASI